MNLKTKKLEIKKVTLQNLHEPTLDAEAGTSKIICTIGYTGTPVTVGNSHTEDKYLLV